MSRNSIRLIILEFAADIAVKSSPSYFIVSIPKAWHFSHMTSKQRIRNDVTNESWLIVRSFGLA